MTVYPPRNQSAFHLRLRPLVMGIILQSDTSQIRIEKPDAQAGAVGGGHEIFGIEMVYITEGSFSADAFYGLLDYTPDEPILTSFNF